MAKAKKPVAASGKRPEKTAAANEIVKEAATASDSRPTFDQLVAILIPLFQRLLNSDAIRDKTHLRYHFPFSDQEWLGLVPMINAHPAIRGAGLAISLKQMKNAQTIMDIAARLIAGPGKFPKLSPVHKGLVKPPAFESMREPSRESPSGDEFSIARESTSDSDAAEPVATEDVSGSDQPAQTSSFFFRLEGEAQGDEALWGKEFDLRFLYGQITGDALAIVKGTKLDPVQKGQVALGVEVVPKGLTLTRGDAFRLVKFKDGAMVGEPPRFALKAPEQRDADDEPAGVYVTFTVTGAIIYSFFLEIRLVGKFSEKPRPGRSIDLDLEQVRAYRNIEPRNALFTVLKKGGPWQVSGVIFDTGYPLTAADTTIISEASLDAVYRDDGILDDIRTIADKTAWRYVDEKLDLPAEHEATALACMQKAATVGNRLYRRFSKDPVFKQVIDLIEALPDGSKITIMTDREAFPWELFYPLTYIDNDRPENFQPERFWGHRFLIESLLLPTSDGEKLPARRQQPGKLHVSMGLNSGIDTEAVWARQTPRPVRVQMDFFDTSLKGRGGYFDQYSDILNIVRNADPASLIYFFCHGSAKELQFDDVNPKLKADNFEGWPDYPGWPVVFINACDAGDTSPVSFYSFRTELRSRKAAGVIAPSFPVPTMFAAMFANAFLTAYANKQPVGKTLLALRRELLAKNNPLGLWYSLQCPLDVRAAET
jgi:hypothetical protein